MATARTKPASKKRTTRPVAPTVPSTASADPRRAGLLAAIIGNPEDKKARLVYADHLQDQADPRGEFIALQCTRSGLSPDDVRVTALAARETDLLKKHKKGWTAFGETKGARWDYRRGFIEKASLDAAALAQHGARLFAAEPVEELNVWKIDEAKGGLAPVLQLPLQHLKRLSLARSHLALSDWAALASATTLGNVEVLDLSVTAMGETGGAAAAFALATSLPKLRELRLNGAYLSDEDLEALASSKTLRFERLFATNNFFGAAGLGSLLDAPWARHLTHLDFSSNEQIRVEGLEVLAGATTLPALKSLRLDYAGIWTDDERPVQAVLDSPLFARLELLDLSQNLGTAQLERIRQVFGARLAG